MRTSNKPKVATPEAVDNALKQMSAWNWSEEIVANTDDEALVAIKHSLPPETCPLVDKVQTTLNLASRELEAVREANENLRETSHKYYRENKKFVEISQQYIKKNKDLVFQNEQLQLKKNYLEGICSGSISIDATLVVDLTTKLDIVEEELVKQKDSFNTLIDLYNAVNKAGAWSRVSRYCSEDSLVFIKNTKKLREEMLQQAYKSVATKLTASEMSILGIKLLPRVDEDDDEDDE